MVVQNHDCLTAFDEFGTLRNGRLIDIHNDQNGIVDDFLTYRIHEDEYLLVVNAANIDKDWAWVNK